MDSILTSIKKLLGIDEDYEQFDVDIIIYINSSLIGLTQIGIGPDYGFRITDKSTTWKNFLDDRLDLDSVKSYVYMSVRLIFDPPQTSYLVDAIKEQLKELIWRLSIQVEALA